MNLITTAANQTMSSREIAELVEVRHDSVKRSMETLRDKGLISFTQSVETSHIGAGSRPVEVYLVGKRDSYVIVAQLSPEFTARLVDRWQELEAVVAAPIALPTQSAVARQTLEDWIAVGALLNVPTHFAQSEGVKQARLLTGHDFTPLLLQAPAQNEVREEDMLLEPSDLAKRFGLHRNAVNPLLRDAGLQYKDGDTWIATDLGKPISVLHQWVAGNKSKYNLKWRVSAVSRFLKREAA